MQRMGMEEEQQQYVQREMEGMRYATNDQNNSSDGDVQKVPATREEGYQGAEDLDQFWTGVSEGQGHAHEGPSRSAYREEWRKLQERLESFDKEKDPLEYKFFENNPFLENDMNAADNGASADNVMTDGDFAEEEFFKKGLTLYHDGNIAEAVYAFEAGVQKRPDNDECWRYLGSCHAENDEDKQAIVCLQKAVECDPYNLEGLLALGTSYVNELDSESALKMLQSWVNHNPRFHGLTVTPDMHSDGTLMDEVMQLVLAAHQHAPDDIDVKVLMGVLYNVSVDFDSAIATLSDAAKMSPGNFNVLNKLGATLANGNKSDEAIPVYKQALKSRPTYARGWLNLGISYANLNMYDEAAKAYVQALHLSPRAKHIWGYLRVVLTCLEKLDLVELCGKEDLTALATNLNVQLSRNSSQPLPDMTLI
jgi:peroxin-5